MRRGVQLNRRQKVRGQICSQLDGFLPNEYEQDMEGVRRYEAGIRCSWRVRPSQSAPKPGVRLTNGAWHLERRGLSGSGDI